MPRRILDFNWSEEQSLFNWLMLYRESATPQVEPVATRRARSPNTIRQYDLRSNRTQMEMEHAFNMDRMAGDEEATAKRQIHRRQRLPLLHS